MSFRGTQGNAQQWPVAKSYAGSSVACKTNKQNHSPPYAVFAFPQNETIGTAGDGLKLIQVRIGVLTEVVQTVCIGLAAQRLTFLLRKRVQYPFCCSDIDETVSGFRRPHFLPSKRMAFDLGCLPSLPRCPIRSVYGGLDKEGVIADPRLERPSVRLRFSSQFPTGLTVLSICTG